MATYATDLATSNQVYTPPGGGVVGVREATFEAVTALETGDVIQMLPVAAGERIVGLQLFVDDLDTGTTLVLDIGDGDDVDRYVDGTTVGQTGGFVELGAGVAAAAAFGLDKTYSVDDTIDVTVAAGPAGGGTGTIKLRALVISK